MAEKTLAGMKIAILVTDNFEQIEMTEPRKALQGAGAQTLLIAPHTGQVQGFNHDEKGETFTVDLLLEQARPEDFDGLLLPGGVLNADALRVIEKAQSFVKKMDRDEKPIAVICHGPWLLVSANIVRGRRMTGYHTIRDDIRNAGGEWQDSEVITDRNWVSSRQPGDIPAFNRAVLDLMVRYRERTKHAA